MAKHLWLLDEDNDPVIVTETDDYPYCMYIKCIRCDDIFCHNGCGGDVFNEECPSNQLELF